MSSATDEVLGKSLARLTLDSDTAIFLMEVEDKLCATGHEELAAKLNKLQQDITAWYAGAGTSDVKQGELTKTFIDAYEEITPQRVNRLLAEIREHLDGDLKQKFSALENEAKIPEAAPAATQVKRAQPKR